MHASLELDVDSPAAVYAAVDPSLQDSERVQFTATCDDTVSIDVEADSLGTLRGGVNTALVCAKLSSRIIGDYV